MPSGWMPTSFSQISMMPSGTAGEGPEAHAELENLNADGGDGRAESLPYSLRAPLFQFPGGTRTGTCWHEIFEKLDFTKWAMNCTEEERNDSWTEVVASLEHHGMLGKAVREERLTAFHGMLLKVCNVPLAFPGAAGSFALSEIAVEKTLREFDFTYQMNTGIDADSLIQLLEKENIKVPEKWHRNIGRQPLTGSIDLLLQSPYDGKIYIIDWKTNILGACQESFDSGGIQREMDEHFYALQCVLYALAYIQYRRQLEHGAELASLAGRELERARRKYSEEVFQSFGGCADLFVRGVGYEKGTVSGIHFTMPTLELILALDTAIGVSTKWYDGRNML